LFLKKNIAIILVYIKSDLEEKRWMTFWVE